MLSVLREVEWAGMEGKCCACCGECQPSHAPDCRLAALLKETA